MILACNDHVERALEDFTIEREAPPDLFRLDQLEPGKQTIEEDTCSYCSAKAIYVVKGYAD
ncbi:MAG: CxxH/CxxC protein [Peptococcia bacterium]